MVCLSVHPSAYLAICNTIYLHLLILQLVVDEAGRLVLDLRGYGLRVRVWVRIGVRARVTGRRRRRLELRDPHRCNQCFTVAGAPLSACYAIPPNRFLFDEPDLDGGGKTRGTIAVYDPSYLVRWARCDSDCGRGVCTFTQTVYMCLNL